MSRRDFGYLFDFDPEIERTLRQLRQARRLTAQELEETTEASTESSEDELQEVFSDMTAPPPKRLWDDGLASAADIPTGTLTPSFTATSFKIDAGFYNIIRHQQFGGLTTEDPAEHINHFCDLCQMITHEGVTPAQLKHLMFPHSLKGKALTWLRSVSDADTWDKLVLAFYHKFFPPERTSSLRMQISGFRQRLNESLYDAWDRYKILEKQCPHHGFGKGYIAMTFYNALNSDSRRILDSAANGRFDSVEVDKAWEVIEEMATHSLGYT